MMFTLPNSAVHIKNRGSVEPRIDGALSPATLAPSRKVRSVFQKILFLGRGYDTLKYLKLNVCGELKICALEALSLVGKTRQNYTET